MAKERVRSQIRARWSAFDTMAESQSLGNETIIRALDIFEGARGAFKAAAEWPAGQGNSSLAVGFQRTPDMFFAQQQQQPSGPASMPRGTANALGDGARLAYFRAEEGLALAREQLSRNEETLRLMAEEVEQAKQCIGACYNTEGVMTRQERRDVRARASQEVLDRGDLGCMMSLVDIARAMEGLLRMHQSEFEMQETVVCGLGYDTSGETLTAYREALRLRPFMDDNFLSQVQEIRELSEALEVSSRNYEDADNPTRTGM